MAWGIVGWGVGGIEAAAAMLGQPVYHAKVEPRQPATLRIQHQDGQPASVNLLLRIDTPIEAAYFSAGGILPYVLEQLLAEAPRASS